MPIISNDVMLLQRLRSSQEFSALGFVAELTEPSGVVLIRAGHAYGLWRFQDEALQYTGLGSHEPSHRTETVDAAVVATIQVLRSTNRAIADFANSQRLVKAACAD